MLQHHGRLQDLCERQTMMICLAAQTRKSAHRLVMILRHCCSSYHMACTIPLTLHAQNIMLWKGVWVIQCALFAVRVFSHRACRHARPDLLSCSLGCKDAADQSGCASLRSTLLARYGCIKLLGSPCSMACLITSTCPALQVHVSMAFRWGPATHRLDMASREGRSAGSRLRMNCSRPSTPGRWAISCTCAGGRSSCTHTGTCTHVRACCWQPCASSCKDTERRSHAAALSHSGYSMPMLASGHSSTFAAAVAISVTPSIVHQAEGDAENKGCQPQGT